MNSEHFNNIHDENLLEIQAQYRSFKSNISDRAIITPSMIEKAVKSNVKSINRILRQYALVCICTILLWILLGVALRLSLAFTITTCTLMAADWIADNWSAYPLKVVTDSNTTLLQGAVMARKSKKRFAISFATGLCILILWFVWLCYEFISSPVCADFFGLDTGLLFIISGGIGGIVGVIIAAHVLRKINNNLKSIDRQIQEYTSQLP